MRFKEAEHGVPNRADPSSIDQASDVGQLLAVRVRNEEHIADALPSAEIGTAAACTWPIDFGLSATSVAQDPRERALLPRAGLPSRCLGKLRRSDGAGIDAEQHLPRRRPLRSVFTPQCFWTPDAFKRIAFI